MRPIHFRCKRMRHVCNKSGRTARQIRPIAILISVDWRFERWFERDPDLRRATVPAKRSPVFYRLTAFGTGMLHGCQGIARERIEATKARAAAKAAQISGEMGCRSDGVFIAAAGLHEDQGKVGSFSRVLRRDRHDVLVLLSADFQFECLAAVVLATEQA